MSTPTAPLNGGEASPEGAKAIPISMPVAGVTPASIAPPSTEERDRVRIAMVAMIGFFGTVAMFYLRPGSLPETAQTQVIGTLGALLGTMVGFWFGQSSAAKNGNGNGGH